MLFMVRYGMPTTPPDPDKVKHLGGVLRKLEKFPPFELLQKLLGRLIPMADPDAKPGGSLFGDLVQYGHGWHEKNPELWQEIYRREPIPEIPFFPKANPSGKPANQDGPAVIKLREPITTTSRNGGM